MKKKIVVIFLLLIGMSSYLPAQDIFYPEIEYLLKPEQKLELEKAINVLLKARGNENNANDIERKFAKLKRKGKEESWRKKTWEAKQQRIMAEQNYKKAYSSIAAVYSQLISEGKYQNPKDKSEALLLEKEAHIKFEEALEQLNQFQDISQPAMEVALNDQVVGSLHDSHQLSLKGFELQIAALGKIVGTGKSAELDAKDDLAWEKAKKANTISSYYEYLNENPRGRHMSEANELISQIEKQSGENQLAINDKTGKNSKRTGDKTIGNDNPDNQNDIKTGSVNPNGLVFRVQIAAATDQISDWMLKAKAPGIKQIDTEKSGIWIKYLVGTFGSYNEAAAYRDEIRSHVPDAFIVVFSKGKQVPVTEQMKK